MLREARPKNHFWSRIFGPWWSQANKRRSVAIAIRAGLDANDLTFATADTMLPQPVPTGLVEVSVSAETGLPLSASEAASATPQSTPTLWVVP
jgi:hypothetical protein